VLAAIHDLRLYETEANCQLAYGYAVIKGALIDKKHRKSG